MANWAATRVGEPPWLGTHGHVMGMVAARTLPPRRGDGAALRHARPPPGLSAGRPAAPPPLAPGSVCGRSAGGQPGDGRINGSDGAVVGGTRRAILSSATDTDARDGPTHPWRKSVRVSSPPRSVSRLINLTTRRAVPSTVILRRRQHTGARATGTTRGAPECADAIRPGAAGLLTVACVEAATARPGTGARRATAGRRSRQAAAGSRVRCAALHRRAAGPESPPALRSPCAG